MTIRRRHDLGTVAIRLGLFLGSWRLHIQGKYHQLCPCKAQITPCEDSEASVALTAKKKKARFAVGQTERSKSR